MRNTLWNYPTSGLESKLYLHSYLCEFAQNLCFSLLIFEVGEILAVSLECIANVQQDDNCKELNTLPRLHQALKCYSLLMP